MLGLGACAASTPRLHSVTSGRVGCEPNAIEIHDYKLGAATASWKASCLGKQYFCSGSDTLEDVACAVSK